ncbi:disulfide bond formation protein B [Paracoccus sp. Z330]|uniref:Disulfide bond formation protein B n=1 Tax=Paracoccus onchidii TaxID=3017813 RepID=A0ABT4ZHM0_9RHOB|nr:disulfide bond formation protein B [Paracoccus onchidii]MDB6178858.1 disulfide bond formation protein B [Paracoccus onchidii]
MTPLKLSLLAGAGSAALLLAALGFQAAGYAPCELCILQRWPHLAAAIIAALIWLTGQVRLLAVLGMAAAAIAMGLAIYHSGVEMAWWAGPAHCSGGVGNIAQMSPQDLLTKLQAAPVTRCDEVSWRFLGLSMASWNAICSAVLLVIWSIAAMRGQNGGKTAN